MEETFRKLYVVTESGKRKIGNTLMGQAVASPFGTETRAIACGFLCVSSWFPPQLKSFLICV